MADSPFPKHDFTLEPTGDAADRFRSWLEQSTADMLRRTFGDPEGTKTAIFLFVNRAYEAKMPDREIGAMFGRCFVQANGAPEDEEAAWNLLEFLGGIAKQSHASE
jgi:hypothetical protein